MDYPIPENEQERLEALNSLQVLDTEPEEAFDHLVKLAAKICNTPMALVTLVDAHRQWFKAREGVNITETSRDAAFCTHTIIGDEIFEIPDASKDPRFVDNPLVTGEMRLRFYAGVPLKVSKRFNLGSLCVLGTQPQKLTEEQRESLQTLAQAVVAQLELRKQLMEAKILTAQRDENLQKLTIANLELKRANQLKDEFLSSMSHELRTPLNVILGLSEALQDDTFGRVVSEEQRDAMERIEQSGRHLLDLINDILDLSRIEAGQLHLDIGNIQILDVCEKSLNLVKDAGKRKRIKISTHYSPAVRDVKTDPLRLKQILVNLLDNAVKFTPNEGEIGLDVTRDENWKMVSLSVWDTGIGISPSDKEKLFQPFVQLNQGLAREHEGTGLGLAMVKRLVELQGGMVFLESEPGNGSRFTVLLPPGNTTNEETGQNEKKSVTKTIPNMLSSNRKFTVLVVEDNEINLRMYTKYLETKKITVFPARSAVEALQQLEERRPDLVLMDIQMPGMDGLEAIRRIRKDPKNFELPIIALTSLAMRGDREKCLEAGANIYLSKPVSLKFLENTISELLN